MTLVLERRGAEAKTVKRFEIWEVDLPKSEGSVQTGSRPCIVTSNNVGNKYSSVVIVSPLTKSKTKKTMPTHIKLDAEEIGLYDDSTILFEQVITVPKEKLAYKITEIPKRLVRAANMALSISLGLES